MAKNKKKKKNRNKDKQALHSVSASTLLHQGKAHLENGKYRDAIAVLKMAIKKGWPRDEVDGILAKAYSLRAVQLREKGMENEAAEVQKHASSLISSYQMLTDEDLLLFIKAENIGKSVSSYVDFLGANPPSKKIEQHLAERFLVYPKWELLDKLDDACALKKDVSQVKDAVRLMTAGEWEAAYEMLKSIPRSSPWATARILCHAMVCFYKEDDTGMQRALNMIADDSVLKPLFQKLTQDIQSVSCLWDGPVHLEQYIAGLCDEFGRHRFKKAGEYIKKIASTISPRATDKAMFHVLELFWAMTGKGRIGEYDYFNLIYKLLPQSLAGVLEAKVDCLTMSPTPFHHAAVYLSRLDTEFPDEKDRAMAIGFIILETIRNYHASFSCGPGEDNGNDLKKLLHLSSDNFAELIPELLVYAIRQDPGNRALYESLVGRMSTNRKLYAWIEQGLSIMKTHFPEDPYPCLELAKLYYRKNAYRKAEKILNEAMARAPHDIRVINMHVMSLLISADKNITRSNLPLARQDIGKAESLVTPATRFLLTEKQILLQIAEKGQLSLFKNTTVIDHGDVSRTIDEFMQRLTPFECLRSLGALFIDVNCSTKKDIWDKKMIRVVDQAIRKRLKSIDALTPSEINALFLPLSLELPVIHKDNMADIFEQRGKGILSKIEDHCILSVLDNLIRSRKYPPVLREIKRRRKTTDEKFSRILDFYEVAVKHFKGELHNDEFAFLDVLEDLPGSEIETVRAAARRLSTMIFDQPALQNALESFDFKYLNPDFSSDGWNEAYDDDDDWDDDFDEFFAPKLNDMYQDMIEILENMIVGAELPGASKKAVLKFKKSILNGPFSLPLDMLADNIDKEKVTKMSRELRIILFGKA